ncbi:MAG: hypothetical protein WBF90_33550 [Rivularia sp. (in: cyanobacteria)]
MEIKTFQGLGVLSGVVSKGEAGYQIAMANQTYPLMLRRSNVEKHLKLGKQNKILVYPKVTHFPERDAVASLKFQLIGCKTENSTSPIFEQLKLGEFILKGIWQFIPACRQPVISIYRNYDSFKEISFRDELSKLKQSKAQHVPTLWFDSPVKPYRFNMKSKEQPDKYFVEIKAKFNLKKNLFIFDSLLDVPTTENYNPFIFNKAKKAEILKMQKESVAA